MAHLFANYVGHGSDGSGFAAAIALMTPVWLLVAYFAGLYHQVDFRIGQDLIDEFGTVLVAITAWAWLFVLLRSVVGDGVTDLTRPFLLWVFVATTLLAFRAALRFWTRRQQWNRRSIALIGDPADAATLAGRIERHPEWCLDIDARIQVDRDDPAMYLLVEGGGSQSAVCEEEMDRPPAGQDIVRAIVVGASESLSARSGLIRKLANEGIAIDHVVGGPETLYSSAHPQHLEGLTVMSMKPSSQPPVSSALKRAIDVGLSAGLLLLALPVLGISALLIRFDSRGPVFFRHPRAGRDGGPSTCSSCADDPGCRLDAEATRARHTKSFKEGCSSSRDDPRVTEVGVKLAPLVDRRDSAALERSDRRDEPGRPAPLPLDERRSWLRSSSCVRRCDPE